MFKMASGITSKMTQLRLSFTLIFVTAYVSEIHTLSQKHAEYVRHTYSPARLSQAYANFHDVSLLACAALCGMAEHCIALNFHNTASKCELISQTEYFREFHSSNDGWRVYSNIKANTIYTLCSSTDDCLDPHSRCIDSRWSETRCYCQPLFQYNHDKRRCEQVCTNLGSSFTKHAGNYIPGHHILQDEFSVADCEQQCRQQGDNCLSFDYRPSGSRCRLNSISLQDATDAGHLFSGAGENLYTKDCDD